MEDTETAAGYTSIYPDLKEYSKSVDDKKSMDEMSSVSSPGTKSKAQKKKMVIIIVAIVLVIIVLVIIVVIVIKKKSSSTSAVKTTTTTKA